MFLFSKFEPFTEFFKISKHQIWIQHTQIMLDQVSKHFYYFLPAPLYREAYSQIRPRLIRKQLNLGRSHKNNEVVILVFLDLLPITNQSSQRLRHIRSLPFCLQKGRGSSKEWIWVGFGEACRAKNHPNIISLIILNCT